MKTLVATVVFGAGLLFGAGAYADTPPAGAIALCKDGTYFTGTSHKGACKGHQGVKEWLDKDKASTASSAAPATDTSSSKSKKSKSSKSADTTAATTAPASTAAPAATKAASTPAPAPAAAPAATTTATTAATTKKPPTPASEIAQKPGGGAGQVWVNSSSKVYHCQGDEWYGKTKEGSYMSEAAAKAAGNHAAHGKDCSG